MFDMMDFEGSNATYQPPSGPIIPEAMDCMRCGICLSHCPTYQLTQDEQEEPRQRVRSLSRLLVDQQALGEEALEHLQSCLQCRACEAVCPSQMNYGELFDSAQSQLSNAGEAKPYARIALYLVAHKKLFYILMPLIKIYHFSGLRVLLRKLGVLKLIGLSRVDQIAPIPVLASLKSYSPVPQARGTVALFSGCLSDRFDRITLDNAIKVLNRIGYTVVVPRQQSCCGAIHLHNGAAETAKQLMHHNVQVFNALSVDAIIYCASGCGSQLQEYQRILADDEQSAIFQDKLFEITQFVDQNWPESVALNASRKKVRVHEPCSQRNVLKNQQAIYHLLNRIPELEVSELADNHLCCGAGGSYMLTHPDNADALRDLKLKQIEQSNADYLVTANIGCSLHLLSSDKAHKPIAVMHPVTLIANQLSNSVA